MRLWAKSLRIFKRAEMGLECLSVPALLHLLHDLSTSSALAIFRRRRQVQQALRQAQERLAMCQASHPGGVAVQQACALVEAHAAAGQRWQQGRSAYRSHLEPLSLLMHPWCLVGSTLQTSHEGAGQCQGAGAALATWGTTPGLPLKQHALEKVRQ